MDSRPEAKAALRPFADVRVISAPGGVSTTGRLRVTADEDAALRLLAAHLSSLRRHDLRARAALGASPSKESMASRKREMTPMASSRWAGSIVRGNDEQYRLARRSQVARLRATTQAIVAIELRLSVAVGTRARQPIGSRGKSRWVRGYATQRERWLKQQRLQSLQALATRLDTELAAGTVHIVDGGRRLADTRHNLDAAGLSPEEWHTRWVSERDTIAANGSRDEPFGNMTITVTTNGIVSIRLPKPLEHLATEPRGRFQLSSPVTFHHRGAEWADQTRAGAVAYRLYRRPGREGWYLTASWTHAPTPLPDRPNGRVLGVDLNADHLACWVLDTHGNPTGRPITIPFTLAGSTGQRDAAIRHTLTRLLRVTLTRGCGTIAIEDLNFDDARNFGRETMGRGAGGRRFRRTVAGIPTAVFRNRLQGMAHTAGIRLVAVNPAYSSMWGDEHWRRPTSTPTHKTSRHEAAAIVIGRRSQGHPARRRTGVTTSDQRIAGVRATVQATTGPHREHGNSTPVTDLPTQGTALNRQAREHPAGQPLPRQTATAVRDLVTVPGTQ